MPYRGDIKPGNVMVRKDGVPFVLDFGIAWEMQETLTRVTGKASSGTLMYMSPEQLSGAPPSPAQDVYSFAAMVYECLTGNPPFHRGQIEYQILNMEPAPLPGDSALTRAVMASLGKNPAGRATSCLAVLGLDVLPDSVTIAAPPPSAASLPDAAASVPPASVPRAPTVEADVYLLEDEVRTLF